MSVSAYKLMGMPEPNKISTINASQKIIQHFVHSYDEHGNVIVVEGDKEDLSKSIPQFQSEVGAKNIIRMIESGADSSILFSNKERAFYGDVSFMDVKSVNELPDLIRSSSSKASEALDSFNKQFGTSLDMKTFISLYDKGLLKDHIEGLLEIKQKEEVSTNE